MDAIYIGAVVKVSKCFNAVCHFGTSVFSNLERVELPPFIILSETAESQLTDEEKIKLSKEREDYLAIIEKNKVEKQFRHFRLKDVNLSSDRVMLPCNQFVPATKEQATALKVIKVVRLTLIFTSLIAPL